MLRLAGGNGTAISRCNRAIRARGGAWGQPRRLSPVVALIVVDLAVHHVADGLRADAAQQNESAALVMNQAAPIARAHCAAADTGVSAFDRGWNRAGCEQQRMELDNALANTRSARAALLTSRAAALVYCDYLFALIGLAALYIWFGRKPSASSATGVES